ncbi:hypothetical protein NDU88_003146 [Pleurodeles waltl]|uniref:Uncharacterized protein n=1 Tax=Pleurodeles waltl TaxID=8319 RepID=A0AAV7Q867_PLEWA|nr:hypothetical protein NDU88_003146 [Pleurodeles waltl]
MWPEASAHHRRRPRGWIRRDTASGTATDHLSGARSRGRSAAPHGERVGRHRGRGPSNPAGRLSSPKQPRTPMLSHGRQHGSRAAEWAT